MDVEPEAARAEQESGRAASEASALASGAASGHSDKGALPVWKPPVNRGRPAAREGGASRGAADAIVVRALVPRFDEAALTLSAQPSVFFALRPDTPHSVNFTLVDPDAIEPLVDVMLPGPFKAGIHRIDLADHGAKLELGRRYEWFVAVVPDPERRSADTLARGTLLRITNPELEREIASASPGETMILLAAEGVWYDALTAISEGVAAMPEAKAPREARAALLEQVGLVSGD